MSEYSATVVWTRGNDEAFIDNRYSRGHEWVFDGGLRVPASASPDIVPLPYSVEANVDPEEAFVASLSSCHMLFFLHIAANENLIVDSYTDDALGVMGKTAEGKMAMLSVTLNPDVSFANEQSVTLEQLENMHHQAHEQCFIANSVTCEVVTKVVL